MQRGYSTSEAEELAYLEERQAFASRAKANRPAETRTRAQLAGQNFSPTEIDRLVGRPTNVDANLEAAATPLTLEPVAGYRDPRQTAYNAETFAEGYGFDDSGNPAFLGRVDIDNPSEGELVDRGRRAYNARDPRGAEVAAAGGQIYGDYVPSDEVLEPLGMTAPGPRTLDGRPAAMPKPLMTPEEVEAYDVRPDRGLSQRDRDMAQRGYVPVVTPDGVGYRLQYVPGRPQNDGYQIPGGPGRAGPRPDLEGNYEPKTMVGPDGNPVQVWSPTKEFSDGQKAVLKTRRDALNADFQKRRDRRIAMAMLAGGSENLNAGNRWIAEALLDMTPEQRASSMRYMLPGGDRAAAVDAGGARNAMRMMNAEALAGMDPTRQAERQRANEAAEAGLPPEQATRLSITRGQPMGSGLSAAYVGSRWNHWMNNFGLRPESWREQNFRSEMEGLGYSPAQIDQWIDQRRGAVGGADPGLGTSTGPGGLPAPPGSTPYRTGA
jgi:hypothetical protein